jgi:hypothetical protein
VASEIDICNLALSRLGDDATVSSLYPPEGSMQAEHCARFYPVARDALLEMHAWGFATRRAQLAQLSGSWPQWAYAYALPADCMVAVAVLPQGATDDMQAQDFKREAGPNGSAVLLTNQPAATLIYQARVADSTKFSPLFIDTLAWLLASYLAGPILKGDAGMRAAQQFYGAALQSLGRAATSDANQQHGRPDHVVPWVSARGNGSTWER